MEFVLKLKLDMERLEREYDARGVVTWTAFKADPTATGVRADESVSYAEIKGLKVSGLVQPTETAKALTIESASVKVS